MNRDDAVAAAVMRAYNAKPLVRLARSLTHDEPLPFEWVVEFAPDGDIVGAAMRLWDEDGGLGRFSLVYALDGDLVYRIHAAQDHTARSAVFRNIRPKVERLLRARLESRSPR